MGVGMKILISFLAFLIFFPLSVYSQTSQGTISQSDAEKYRNFLNEQRVGEKSGNLNYKYYPDDRNTKVRKLSESIHYHDNEARIAKEQSKYERMTEKEDLKLSKEKKMQELVDKGVSAKSDKEADRYYKGAKELKDSKSKTKKNISVGVR
jgi:hypothetical protein